MALHTHAKRILFLAVLALCAALLAAAALALAIWAALPDVSFLEKPGVSFEITVFGWDGTPVPFTVGPANRDWTPLDQSAQFLRDAVVASEDFSFFSHKGVDWFEVKEAIRRDLAERRPVRGASTITQQLAKNLFLSRDKTLVRKLKELALARGMEKALTKERILELYINVVELGPLVYGVGAGSRYHFRKAPSDLTLRESAFLAAMLPSPRVYDPYRKLDRVMTRADRVLAVMLKGRMISEEDYRSALGELPFLPRAQQKEPEKQLPDSSEEEPDQNAPAIESTVSGPGKTPMPSGTEPLPFASSMEPESAPVEETANPRP